MKRLRELAGDDRGDAPVTMLTHTLVLGVTFAVFMMMVLWCQLTWRRDCVDHAATVAADTATKTYCAKEESTSASEQAARKAIAPILATVGGQDVCQLAVQPSGGGEDPGTQELQVSLRCQFPCDVPIASRVMCDGGKVSFNAKRKTTALGCDGKGTGT